MGTQDDVAAVLEKLTAREPDLTAQLIELLARADISSLCELFGEPKQVVAAGASGGADATAAGSSNGTSAVAASPAPSSPPPVIPVPVPASQNQDLYAGRQWDGRGFLIGPRSPNRFPRPRDEKMSGWAA